MNKKSKEYKNLVHNCALVYNAVPLDVYMKFHANVNASDWIDLEQEYLEFPDEVIDLGFDWGFTEQGSDYWETLSWQIYRESL